MPPSVFVARSENGRRVLDVIGDVDLANADDFRAAVLGPEREPLVEAIDLTGCTFMDSTGIGVMVALFKALGKPILVAVRSGSHLLRVFSVAGIGEIMELTEVTQHASLGRGQS